MLTRFDDIVEMTDLDVQRALQEITVMDVSMALRATSEEVKEKIYCNVSERVRRAIQEDLGYMSSVSDVDVEATQQRIIDVVCSLKEAGEIAA